MQQTSSTTSAGTGAGASRASTVGILTIIAGALVALGTLVSIAVEWAWFATLVALALLVYVTPQLHRFQSPADGWAGKAGSLLVAAGAGLIVAVGVVFLVLEAVGDPGEPAWAGVAWMVGFFAFVVGVVLFAVGSARARVFPPGAPLLMLVGLASAVAIDMATGAFFQDDSTITAWGAYIGIPLFGLGLAWLGYAQRNASRTGPSIRG